MTALHDAPTESKSAPPPPPHPGNVSDPKVAAKLARENLRLAKERQRELRKQSLADRVKGVDRSYYVAGACILGAGLAFMGVRSILGFQRDTALALQSERTPTSEAPQVVQVQGIENPLEQLPLTYPARWMIGLNSENKLVPNRSTDTMAALLKQVDLCGVYIRLGSNAEIELLDSPAAGAQPLVECPATATPVETPVDPAPPSSVPGA